MRRLPYMAAALVALCAIGLLAIVATAPRLNWSASSEPSIAETKVAQYVVGTWVRIHAGSADNPIAPTAENLKLGEDDFNEHCAMCHGTDGSGRNRLEAEFYPPVPKLTAATQSLSDSAIYFIIANGVALSAMPAFGRHHEADEIWRTVLWIRHLARLSPEERARIERAMNEEERGHEDIMNR